MRWDLDGAKERVRSLATGAIALIVIGLTLGLAYVPIHFIVKYW